MLQVSIRLVAFTVYPDLEHERVREKNQCRMLRCVALSSNTLAPSCYSAIREGKWTSGTFDFFAHRATKLEESLSACLLLA